ncbi:hypothetical protein GCM10009603_25330 [Nocardiopsis exhalans]
MGPVGTGGAFAGVQVRVGGLGEQGCGQRSTVAQATGVDGGGEQSVFDSGEGVTGILVDAAAPSEDRLRSLLPGRADGIQHGN